MGYLHPCDKAFSQAFLGTAFQRSTTIKRMHLGANGAWWITWWKRTQFMDKEQWMLRDEREWGKEEVQMLVWLGTTATHVLCLLHLSVSPGFILASANTFPGYHWVKRNLSGSQAPPNSFPTLLHQAHHPIYASSHLLEVVHRSSPVLTFPTHPAGDRQWHPRPFLVSTFPLLPWCSVMPSQHWLSKNFVPW